MPESNYRKMFKPIKIKNIELKNRLVMAPATTNYSQAGYVTEQEIAYIAARARGGVGLVITAPASYLMPGSSVHVVVPLLSERAHMPMWNEWRRRFMPLAAKYLGKYSRGYRVGRC